MDYLRIRGAGNMTLGGFSQSVTITTAANGYGSGTLTFSIPNPGTSSTTTYTNAIYTVGPFTGTASGNTVATNVKMSIGGQTIFAGGGGYTFSATQSATTSIATLVATMSFTGAALGYSAAASGTSIVFTAASGLGNLANTVAFASSISGSASMAIGATSGTFSGGGDLYTMVVTTPSYFGFSSDGVSLTI